MFNPRDLEKMMKNMKMEQIEADEVLIKAGNNTIHITNPQVVKSEMMGKITYQVTGDIEEENGGSDIDIIVQKTGVSREDASKALEETGDIVAAIMKIESDKKQ
ncbi:MAG: nascent polypeptide-associated complex protein [Candidatus Aenigmarchaeota archaeon]|nr:nascent polypeptide-associated complex protein [Candidatus Aenigmarchaeota archaeon]